MKLLPIKLIAIFSVLFFLCFFGQVPVRAETTAEETENMQETGELFEKQLEALDLEELALFWEKLVKDYGGFLPESQKGTLMEFLKGEKEFSVKEWLVGFLKYMFHEFVANGKLLGTLIMLTIFSMFLQSLQNSFEKTSVSKIAYAIVLIVLIIIALNSFHVVIDYTDETINTMVSFITALVPLLLALMASSGGLVSAAFFHPVILFLINVCGLFVKYLVLPLLFISALLNITSTLSDNYKVTQLGNLFRNWSIGLLGIFTTVFVGVISVQGASSAVTDGIALRTAKFITGNFIPVIGRMFTDATDTIITASLLLKNTVGLAGVAILLLIVAFPSIKILMVAFVYKFAAAIMQPLGGGPVIKCLDIISKSVMYVFASLAMVSLMFFLSLTVIIAAGNLTVMVR